MLSKSEDAGVGGDRVSAHHGDPWLRTDEPLLWMGGAGQETRSDMSYYYDSSKRSDRQHVVLQYTLRGQGFYQREGKRSVLPPGWMWVDVIPGNFEYGYHSGSPLPYELVFVSLIGPDAMAWHQRLTDSFGHVLNVGLDSLVGSQLLAIAHARDSGRMPDRYVQSGMLYQVLMTIFSTLNRTRLSTSPRVMQAIQLISKHAVNPDFGVNALAERMDCSREHLARLFLSATGVSPSDYLLQHRLRRVAQALRSGNEKLETIARRCGFSGANYLVRAFRQRVGTTPARFRRMPWLSGP
jgi:AraC-like DNA-binding protein